MHIKVKKRPLNDFITCVCGIHYISGYTHCPSCGIHNPNDYNGDEKTAPLGKA